MKRHYRHAKARARLERLWLYRREMTRALARALRRPTYR